MAWTGLAGTELARTFGAVRQTALVHAYALVGGLSLVGLNSGPLLGTAAVVAGLLAVLVASRVIASSWVSAAPPHVTATALRERSRRARVPEWRDPDAASHPRPRAPSA